MNIKQWLIQFKNRRSAFYYNKLAEINHKKDRIDLAESFYLKAIPAFLSGFHRKHLQLGNIYNNLAEIYRSKQEYSKAGIYYNKAIALGEELLGADHPDLSVRYYNLAVLYHQQKKIDEAEFLYRKAINIDESIDKKNYADLFSGYLNLALLLTEKGNEIEAQKYLKQALQIDKTLVAEKVDLLLAHHVLAISYLMQRQFSPAEEQYLECLKLIDTLPDLELQAKEIINGYISCLKAQGKTELSDRVYQKYKVILST